jgi:hypothetical protein
LLFDISVSPLASARAERNGRGDGSKIGLSCPQRKCRLALISIAERYSAQGVGRASAGFAQSLAIHSQKVLGSGDTRL